MAQYIGRTFIGTIYGGRIAFIDFNDFRSRTGLPSLISRSKTRGSRLERRLASDQQYFRQRTIAFTTTTNRGRQLKGNVGPSNTFISRVFDLSEDVASPGELARGTNIFGHELQQRYSAPVVRWHRLGKRYLERKQSQGASPNFFDGSEADSSLNPTPYLRGQPYHSEHGWHSGTLEPTSRAESEFYRRGRTGRIPLRSVLGELRVSFLPKLPISVKTSLLRGDITGRYGLEKQLFPPLIAAKLINDSFPENSQRHLRATSARMVVSPSGALILQQAIIRSSRTAGRRTA